MLFRASRFLKKAFIEGPIGVSASLKDVEVFQGDSQPLSCTTQRAGRETLHPLKSYIKFHFALKKITWATRI